MLVSMVHGSLALVRLGERVHHIAHWTVVCVQFHLSRHVGVHIAVRQRRCKPLEQSAHIGLEILGAEDERSAGPSSHCSAAPLS